MLQEWRHGELEFRLSVSTNSIFGDVGRVSYFNERLQLVRLLLLNTLAQNSRIWGNLGRLAERHVALSTPIKEADSTITPPVDSLL